METNASFATTILERDNVKKEIDHLKSQLCKGSDVTIEYTCTFKVDRLFCEWQLTLSADHESTIASTKKILDVVIGPLRMCAHQQLFQN